jgi:hypothetical protein
MCLETFNLRVTADFPAQENCCWCLVQQTAGHFFVALVFFTDEACFRKHKIIHIHNQYQWTEKNPHGVIHPGH